MKRNGENGRLSPPDICGSVNVRAYPAELRKGCVRFQYDISFMPIITSYQGVYVTSLIISVPNILTNVHMTWIGICEEGKFVRNIYYPLKIMNEDDYYLMKNHDENFAWSLTSEAEYNQKEIAVLKYNEKSLYFLSHQGVSHYALNSLVNGPIALKVEGDLSINQARKSPFMPLDARGGWITNSLMDGVAHRQIAGRLLDDFRPYAGHAYQWLASPDRIQESDFDEHGLYTAFDVAVTRNSSHWSLIGRDLMPGARFLQRLTDGVWGAERLPEYEDMADIAVSAYHFDEKDRGDQTSSVIIPFKGVWPQRREYLSQTWQEKKRQTTTFKFVPFKQMEDMILSQSKLVSQQGKGDEYEL